MEKINENKLINREAIDSKYQWDIVKFYENDTHWEESFIKLKTLLTEVEQYKGTLNKSLQQFKDFIILKEEIIKLTSRLYTYAKMRWDENTKSNIYKGLFERAQNISADVETIFSFAEPEIINSLEKITKFSEADEKLQEYTRYFEKLKIQKDHILSKQEEIIISEASVLGQGPENIFSVLSDSDLPFPSVTDEQGQQLQLSHGRYSNLLESYQRNVRSEAFQAMYSTYQKYANTYSSILTAHLKTDIFHARVRKYHNSLEAALKPNEMPVSVYSNLIDAVNKSLPILQKYLHLRKQKLNVGDIHMYDLYVPIVPDINYKLSYEQACQILIEAFTPLGEDYVQIIKDAFEQRWIDVFENDGKRSGAYSWGSYDTYPYILMNYQNNLNSLFTLAHELGHSLHSYYSKKQQPFATADYVIFVAEVASTVNETLLFHYLMKTSNDPKFKAYLMNYFIEGFRTTVFRQTMFAEFERDIHESIERGDSLTSEQLSEMYYKLNLKYYSPAVSVDKDIEVEWARIPHFYYNYYVYQYATGFSAAQALAKQILEDKSAVQRYIQFLSGGSSKTPIALLQDAGVDMTSTEPILEAFKVCEYYINELEKYLT